MHKGAEFSRLQRVLNFFLKRATDHHIELLDSYFFHTQELVSCSFPVC